MKRIKNKNRTVLSSFIVLILILAGVFLSRSLANKNTYTSASRQKTSTPTQLPTVQGTIAPLFSDDFVDNSKGWSVVNEAGYTRSLQTGTLMLSNTTHNVLVESVPTHSQTSHSPPPLPLCRETEMIAPGCIYAVIVISTTITASIFLAITITHSVKKH